MLRWINRVMGFGFGLIDNWIFAYAFSTGIAGWGAGMIVVEVFRGAGKGVPLNAVVLSGTALIVIGTVGVNVSHEVLKRKARQSRQDAQGPVPKY